MPMATIHKVGQSGDLYHIHFLDPHAGTPGTDPGFGQGRPPRPDQGLPGQGSERPDQGLPGGRPDRPDQGLPGTGAHPGNRPPGSGGGGIPDNELPDNPPPQVAPGHTLVLVRDQQGKWHYATIAPGSPPPRPVPNPPEHVGGRPPGQGAPPRPDQGLPPGAAPKPAG